MSQKKYIVVEDEHGVEHAIVFGHLLTHSTVAGRMLPIAGGFYELDPDDDGAVRAYGKSESLKLQSRGDLDAELIARLTK